MCDKTRFSAFCRISTLIICLIFGVLMFSNSSKIHDIVQENVFPVVAEVLYGRMDYEIMDDTLSKMIDQNSNIVSVVVYRFIPDVNTSIYKDQMVIAIKSKLGEYKDVGYKEPISVTGNFQNILLNKIQYDNTKTIKILCENLFDVNHVYSCEKFRFIDSTNMSVVSIPILDTNTFGVIGYVMVTLDSEYNHTDVQNLVNSTKQYIQRLEMIIKHKN